MVKVAVLHGVNVLAYFSVREMQRNVCAIYGYLPLRRQLFDQHQVAFVYTDVAAFF